MSDIRYSSIENTPVKHKHDHADYEYIRRDLLPRGISKNCMVSVYEIPPHRSAYPYHYHHRDEEVFYILSGSGVLRTPEGEKRVSPGDMIYFPADENGAHKLTNDSDSEKLVYIDFDVIHDLDVVVYPDSGKIGVWGKGVNKVFTADSSVDYYTGE